MGILSSGKAKDVLDKVDDLLEVDDSEAEIQPLPGMTTTAKEILEAETDVGDPEDSTGFTTTVEDAPAIAEGSPTTVTLAEDEPVTDVEETVSTEAPELPLPGAKPEPGQPAPKSIKVDKADTMPKFDVGDIQDVTDIRNYAMKVTFRQRRWYGYKRDRKAEEDVATANKAKGHPGRFTKNLLHGADKELRAVHSAIDKARTAHYQMTLPWSVVGSGEDGRRMGPRVLANSKFFEYVQKMTECKKEVQKSLDEFEPKYADLKDEAKQNLGDLYNDAEYPDVSSIRDQFGLDFDFEPIPDGTQFKQMGIEDTQANKLADLLNRRTKDMARNMMEDVWRKLYQTVSHMVDRLSDPNTVFHKTLLTNAEEVAGMLKDYNFTKDPRLEQMRRELEGKLLVHDAKELRSNKEVRAAVAQDAKRVLDTLHGYGLSEGE